jgi:hypothetical protein
MLCHSLRRYLLRGNLFNYRLLRVTQSLTPSKDIYNNTYNNTYNSEDTHNSNNTYNSEIIYNSEDIHKDTHNGEDIYKDTHNSEYTHNSENTRSNLTRKRKRASLV